MRHVTSNSYLVNNLLWLVSALINNPGFTQKYIGASFFCHRKEKSDLGTSPCDIIRPGQVVIKI